MHAEDVVTLYFKAIEHADRLEGGAYNVGGGLDYSMSVKELIAWFSSQLGLTPSVQYNSPRQHDQKVFVAKSRALAGQIGWKPTVAPEAGLTGVLKAHLKS